MPRLQEIERDAAALFRDTKYAALADGPPLPLEFLQARQRVGAVWVAATSNDDAVGFAVVFSVDGALHLHELSVAPAYGRRGLGRRLIEAVCAAAIRDGYDRVTLSTFREIAWNGPFYRRCGFTELADDALSPGLRDIRKKEAAAGLPLADRTCMSRKLSRGNVLRILRE
ncbi:MAG: GNAT family N-acetyltransferase [Blastocatellia bacterium]|nr:GNAT family N-acetyltransferase [Blastocatellia bacterium]